MKNKFKNIVHASTIPVLCLFAFIMVIAIGNAAKYPGSDHYFMYKHAKVLLQKGFITVEPLRIHKGLFFMIPQWAFALLFYAFCQLTGSFTGGYKILIFVTFGCLIATMMIVSYKKAKKTSVLYYSLALALAAIEPFANARPFFITASILVVEAFLLNKIQEKNSKLYDYLFLFVLSVLQINFHNSLWIGMILVWLCYFVNELCNRFVLKRENVINEILKAFFFLAIGGFVNPYGISYILYIFSSFQSIQPLKPVIGELQPLYMHFNLLYTVVLLIDILYFAKNIKKLNIAEILLYTGFLLMYFINVRNLVLFFTVGHYGFFKLWHDYTWAEHSYNKQIIALILFVTTFSLATVSCKIYDSRQWYCMVDEIEKFNIKKPENTTLYSNVIDMGSYAIYKGYRPYIDGCAEIYGKGNNHKFDYASEFMKSATDTKELKKVCDKYQFDFLILGEYHFKNKAEEKEYGYHLVESKKLKCGTLYLYEKIQ